MENLNNIFEDFKNPGEKSKKIKRVPIDWYIHSEGVASIANSIENDFIINENNKPVLRLLLQYFTGNPEFEKTYENGLNKGLMLIGPIGTGKSLLFNIFKQYTMNILQINGYQYHTCLDIVDQVNISGVEYLEKFSHNFNGKIPNPITCYIDDIASKNETVKNYGTEINAIEQLLSLRYEVFERYGVLTHCSTNKYPAELYDIYDSRIVDRMKKMFNIIELKGKSFRK